MIDLVLNWVLPSIILVILLLLLYVQNLLVIDVLCQRLSQGQTKQGVRLVSFLVGLGLQAILVYWFMDVDTHSSPLFELGFWKPNLEDLIFVFGGMFLSYQMWRELLWPSKKLKIPLYSQGFYRILALLIVAQVFFVLESAVTITALQTHIYLLYLLIFGSALLSTLMYQKIQIFFLTGNNFKIILQAFMAVLGLAFFLKGLHFVNSIAWIYPMVFFACVVEYLNMRNRRLNRIQNELRELE